MKSLFFVLALNVFLSAADTVQDKSNASDVSKVGSRKIKHTISRIFRVPHNTASQSVNDINSESYKELIDILNNKVLEKQDIETSERSGEYRNINDLNADKLVYLYKDVPATSKVNSQEKNGDELIENFDALNETRSKLYSVVLNKNGKIESLTDGNITTKETELNADILREIIQNLKVSNVSNFGNKRNNIRKGKLIIYYDDKDGPGKNSFEISTDIEKNYESKNEREKKIEEEILNLFVQYDVPRRIYYSIQGHTYVDEKERIKDLITGFVKHIVDKGHPQLDIFNKLKLLIAENNIDLDLKPLLIASWNQLDGNDLNTETQTINATYKIKSIFNNSDDIIQENSNKNSNETTTVLNIPIVKQIDHVLINNNVNDTIENLLVNPKNSINPAINPNPSSILKDILFQRANDNVKTTNEKIIEGLLSEMKTIVSNPKDIDHTNNEKKVKSGLNSNNNIFEDITRRSNISEDVVESLLEKINHSVETRGIGHDQNDHIINLLKSTIKAEIFKNKERLKEDIVSSVIEHLKDKSSIKIAQPELSCDQNWSCDRGKNNNDNVNTVDSETLNILLNRALQDIVTQPVDSDFSAFSNLPVHEYLKYNMGKPFHINVIFPEPGKKNPVLISDWINKPSRKPIGKDQRPNELPKGDDKRNMPKEPFPQPYSPEEIDKYNIINIMKNIITEKQNINQPENSPYGIITEIIQEFPDNNIPNNILNILNKPQKPFYENDDNLEDPIIDVNLNDLPNVYNNNNNKFYPEVEIDTVNHNKPAQSHVIDDIISLHPNIYADGSQEFPNMNIPANIHEYDTSNKIKELWLALENHIIPKNTHDYGRQIDSLRNLIEEANSLKTLLKLTINDSMKKQISEKNILKTTEDENIDQLMDGLIKQLLYLQKILEIKNTPPHIIREIIEREARKGILKITKIKYNHICQMH